MNVYFKKLNDDAVIPSKKSIYDAGLDFYSTEPVLIRAGRSSIIKTGIAWEVEEKEDYNSYMQMKSRSGMAFKHGIECTNAGVIDSNYKGEIAIKLYNTTKDDFIVQKHDRVAQGIIHILPFINVETIEQLRESDRGENGFGSSGN